jgi:hypothetical protein
MVYLDIFGIIEDYLIEEDIYSNIESFFDEIFNLKSIDKSKPDLATQLIIEFSLFNYEHESELLIDFLYNKLYPNLDEDEKEEFMFLKNSKRYNLSYVRKIDSGDLDYDRIMYYYYFNCLDTNKEIRIKSSSDILKSGNNINVRLINIDGYNYIIGMINSIERYNKIMEALELKNMILFRNKINEYFKDLINFSKTHTFKEINSYNNPSSNFINEDRIIMKYNKLFYDKFNLSIDDFINNLLEIFNDSNRFISISEYYLTFSKEFRDTFYNTNYLFNFFFFNDEIIEGLLSYLKRDKEGLNKSIEKIIDIEEEEFKNELHNRLAFTKENIIKNTINYMEKEINKFNLDDYNNFILDLKNYNTSDLEEFLIKCINYLNDNIYEKNINLDKIDDDLKESILFKIEFLEIFLDSIDEIPDLEDEIKSQEENYFDRENFYDYVDVDNKEYDLVLFLYAINKVYNDKQYEAYQLLKLNPIEKIDSFEIMFVVGKIFSFYNNKLYKTYFNKAKELNPLEYKRRLGIFLKEKEEGKLIL